jgi:hypothetical protein
MAVLRVLHGMYVDSSSSSFDSGVPAYANRTTTNLSGGSNAGQVYDSDHPAQPGELIMVSDVLAATLVATGCFAYTNETYAAAGFSRHP